VQGVQRKFEKYLQVTRMSETSRRIVVPLGEVGPFARGALFRTGRRIDLLCDEARTLSMGL